MKISNKYRAAFYWFYTSSPEQHQCLSLWWTGVFRDLQAKVLIPVIILTWPCCEWPWGCMHEKNVSYHCFMPFAAQLSILLKLPIMTILKTAYNDKIIISRMLLMCKLFYNVTQYSTDLFKGPYIKWYKMCFVEIRMNSEAIFAVCSEAPSGRDGLWQFTVYYTKQYI